MGIIFGMIVGFGAWFILRYVLTAFYTVDQNERAVKTVFGRAECEGKGHLTLVPPRSDILNQLIAARKAA